jgi:hypothetical protein
MPRVLILVEGQTEEAFVKEVLRPSLEGRAIYLIPTLAVTKFTKSGGRFKGGVTSYEKVKSDLRRLLSDTRAAMVTTMLDYYGLPDDFPGMSTRRPGDCYQRVMHVEEEFKKDIGHPRFEPYLALHEFEALLFADPAKSAFIFGTSQVLALERHRELSGGAERIDEGPATAPSKRIQKVFPAYQKVLHGSLAAAEIGLPTLRRECRHFDAWVTKLEKLP